MGVKIERRTELISLRETGEKVEAKIKTPRGKETTSLFSWVIGCDGAHSTVRKELGLSFEGTVFTDVYSLADVALSGWPYPHDEGTLFFEKNGLLLVFPMPGKNRYRLVFQLARCRGTFHPEEEISHGAIPSHVLGDPTLEEIQSIICQISGKTVEVSDPLWLANFHINSRMIRRFHKGRVFLAGDAAHIHSPVGGQGMNTGIQDAFNLAWKLALVHKKKAPPSLLDTYDLERRNLAKTLLKGTAFATRMATLKNPFAIVLRNFTLSCLLKIPAVHHRMTRILSQIAIRYPKSQIVCDLPSFTRGPRAGERLPNVKVFTEQGESDLDALLENTACHTLLLFTGHRAQGFRMTELAELAARSSSRFPFLLEAIVIALTPERPQLPSVRCVFDPDGEAHELFGAKREAAYLVRPDQVVGCRFSPVQESYLMKYMS